MPDLLIKNVPEHVLAKLRQRAVDNRRSLQDELLDIVCSSTEEGASSGLLSIEEIAAELKPFQHEAANTVPLAVDIIRQDRDAR